MLVWSYKKNNFCSTVFGKQNVALHGKSNKLYDRNNGNFLKCIEMLEKFDPFISEHTRHVANDSDLGDKIENEILSLLASNITDNIKLYQQNIFFNYFRLYSGTYHILN